MIHVTEVNYRSNDERRVDIVLTDYPTMSTPAFTDLPADFQRALREWVADKVTVLPLKTPDEWCTELGARVLDADGWRDGTWGEPITREEFDRRLLMCTIDAGGYPGFLGGRR